MQQGYFILLILLITTSVNGDVYLQNPRGSNNKLNEQSNNVKNNRRLQNNGNGGYQVGDHCKPNCHGPTGTTYKNDVPGAGEGIMEYYEGSELRIEWTMQHGCGRNPLLHCNMVLQYACEDHPHMTGLRDGKTTDRIVNDPNDPKYSQYGQHETKEYYDMCSARERNKGLFLADQNLAGRDTAIHTRQDTNGNKDRYGFECPEERDYYPYWHPSPFRDIYVCTDEPFRCPGYRSESQNVRDKGFCSNSGFNNQKDCESNGGIWELTGAFHVDPPECGLCPTTRNNHLGNTDGQGDSPSYTWRIPMNVHEDGTKCLLRLRYNISTDDYDSWNTFKASNGDNSAIKQNPTKDYVGLGDGISGPLQLAVDSDQYGRVFQDRTHVFRIRKRPAESRGWIGTSRIINLNVRGRRGNIVQVYPAVEYDFVPKSFTATKGDYVHIQWTGSDANQAGNTGQGRDGTDRNNLVFMSAPGKNYPLSMKEASYAAFTDDSKLLSSLAFLNQENCAVDTKDTQNVSNCKLLNAAPAYMNFGLVKLEKTGTFHFMSTRNNRFSNREQKGTFTVEDDWVTAVAATGVATGSVLCLSGLVFLFFRVKKRRELIKSARTKGSSNMVLTNEFDDDIENGSVEKIPLSEKYVWLGKLKNWYDWESKRIIFFCGYSLCVIAVWVYGYGSNLNIHPAPFYAYAKGFGKVLDIALGFVLIPVLRNFLSFLRTTPAQILLPLDDNFRIHRITAYLILATTAGHVAMHYCDYIWAQNKLGEDLTLNAIWSLSGHLVMFLLLIMFCTALFKRKVVYIMKRRLDGYSIFMSAHRLWIPAYALLWLHSPSVWTFTFWPLAFIAIEKYIQSQRSRLDVTVLEANLVGQDVLCVKLRLASKSKKFRFKAGQYLFLNCPSIAENEWHPFTITSAPEESNYFSCHIRCRSNMDWTYKLRQKFGFADTTDAAGTLIPARKTPITEDSNYLAPSLKVDGPYGSASEEVFDYHTVMLVGAGIGVTPFISVLRSINIRMSNRSADEVENMRVYFYWICRDPDEFSQFSDIFDSLLQNNLCQGRLEINTYVTGEINLKTIQHERYNQFAGKPNWNRIMKEKAIKHRAEEIGVFLCGPSTIARDLSAACRSNSVVNRRGAGQSSERTLFKFHKENF